MEVLYFGFAPALLLLEVGKQKQTPCKTKRREGQQKPELDEEPLEAGGAWGHGSWPAVSAKFGKHRYVG